MWGLLCSILLLAAAGDAAASSAAAGTASTQQQYAQPKQQQQHPDLQQQQQQQQQQALSETEKVFPCVKLRGIPFDANEDEVRLFLVRVWGRTRAVVGSERWCFLSREIRHRRRCFCARVPSSRAPAPHPLGTAPRS